MKKNLISIVILALLIVNIALTAIMMFSVTGTAKKTSALVDDIATAINLELTGGGGSGEPVKAVVPMSGAKYSNNDELSSGRALSVFDYLLSVTNLNPADVKHAGRGEYLPIADNSTAEGRAKNRRVEIKIYNSLSSY